MTKRKIRTYCGLICAGVGLYSLVQYGVIELPDFFANFKTSGQIAINEGLRKVPDRGEHRIEREFEQRTTEIEELFDLYNRTKTLYNRLNEE